MSAEKASMNTLKAKGAWKNVGLQFWTRMGKNASKSVRLGNTFLKVNALNNVQILSILKALTALKNAQQASL